MKSKFLVITLFLCILVKTSAQEGYTFKKESLNSEILKQNRTLSVFLPEGYNAPDAKFPVIYVLDGDGRCQHIVPTARFLFNNAKMPKVIVVGVDNVDRNHDFLPDSAKYAPMGGGANHFMEFFRKELIPYINKNYKTEAFNVLIGHSYGGEFVMHALINDPDLFNAYIAIDPSFWYKDTLLVKSASKEFLKTKNWEKTIYISGREGQGMEEMGINAMEKLLKSSSPKDLNWKIVAYANEDHGSVTFKSAYDGLRLIFDNGGNFMVYPQMAILPKGSSTYAFIENRNPNLRYTLDGSEPTSNSPLCEDKIKIDKACLLKVKNISPAAYSSQTITRVFAEGEYMDGLKSVKNLKQGLKYTYYEGVWDSVPDFTRLKSIKQGITDSLNMKIGLKKDSFAIVFEGYLHISKQALYNLWDVSDDGSKVYFNNQLILNNDGLHSDDKPVVCFLPLNPGYYPIKIQCFERTGGESIVLGAVVGDEKPKPIVKEMFFYKEK
jgi:predicted alpha/beta superfamily hydrolase